jgi:N-methylhydantoinase A/oxoprolinase/acetone carboxylase beta subunit
MIFGGQESEGAIWLRRRLAAGQSLSGPGLVVEYSGTTVLPPGARAEVGSTGALAITLG